MSKKKVTSLVWFRNNLRVLDNISLTKSIEESDKTIGFINIDPNDYKETSFGFKKTEKFRAKFLLESISDFSIDFERETLSKTLRLFLNQTKLVTFFFDMIYYSI